MIVLFTLQTLSLTFVLVTMKRLVFVLYLGIITDARPSLPLYTNIGVGEIIKGPNSETIIKGPDGSVITAEAGGGSVAVEAVHPTVGTAKAIIAGSTAAASVSVNALSLSQAPIVVADAPLGIAAAPAVPVLAGFPQFAAAPAIGVAPVAPTVSASLEGPSGSVLTVGQDAIISGPSSTTIREGQVVASIPKGGVVNTVLAPAPTVETVALVTPGPIVSPAYNVGAHNLAAAQFAAAENERIVAEQQVANAIQASAVNANLLAQQQAVLAENARIVAQVGGPALGGVNGLVGGIQTLGIDDGRTLIASAQEAALNAEAERNALAQAVASRDRLLLSQEAQRNAIAAEAERNAIAAAAAERNAFAATAERNAIAATAERNALAAAEAERQTAAVTAERNAIAAAAERNAIAAAEAERQTAAVTAERNAIAAAAERNAIAAAAERDALTQAVASRDRLLIAKEAERNAVLAQAINPVITQGGQLVADIPSTTLSPLLSAGIISPTKLRRVGPNGNIVSSTFRPIVSTTPLPQIPAGAIVSTTPQGLLARTPTILAANLHNKRPIILQPDGVPQVVAGPNGIIPDWRASVPGGHIAAQAVFPKYGDVIH